MRSYIPSAVTLCNAACGLAVILRISLSGSPAAESLTAAGIWIVPAWICDAADGPIARLLKSPSKFGAELDSLADAVSFGAAPAVLLAFLAPANRAGPVMGIIGIAAALAYLSCVLIRLALFNIQSLKDAEQGHLYFRGLPSPVAALTLICGVLLSASLGLTAPVYVLSFLLSSLMLTSFPYADLPKHYRLKLKPIWHLAIIGAGILVAGPIRFGLLFLILYSASVPLKALWNRIREAASGDGHP